MRKSKAMKSVWMTVVGAAALAWPGTSAQGQSPVIASFGSNGELVCTNLQPGSTASVEWASSVLGPWTNSWAALAAVTADTNGAIRVSVPMFYRVRGTPPSTNPPTPAGMALIPAGNFTMGNTFSASEGDPTFLEIPTHTVYVSAVNIDKYEVTKTLWDAVYNWATNHGYSFDNAGLGKAANHPVQTINWYDCLKWCNARSEKEGLLPAYYTSTAQTTVYRTGQIDLKNEWVKWHSGYRLPTEAEWEKAARGGTNGQRFPWGNTVSWSQANYYAIPSLYPYDVNPTEGQHPAFLTGVNPFTSPVGYFSPNGYGLYDMAGNVAEWCWDRLDNDWYSNVGSTQDDPRGPNDPYYSGRVRRGGGCASNLEAYTSALRCAYRTYYFPVSAKNDLGFRCVRGL
jgi:formylglycine-generating enzyme required for sulfatase activity